MNLINKLLLVKRKEKKKKTEGGIAIPETAQEKPTEGILLDFDKKLLEDYPELQIGNTVGFADYCGIEQEDENNVLLRIEEIWWFNNA